MAVYFFYGEEDFNIDLELDKMRSKLNPDFIAMNYKLLDNPDFAELINAVRTAPMMFGSSLIIIDACKYFFSEGNKFEDKELQELNFLTKKDIQRSQTLISLKDFYQKELRSLEMVL